jgi:hypothetical protein
MKNRPSGRFFLLKCKKNTKKFGHIKKKQYFCRRFSFERENAAG